MELEYKGFWLAVTPMGGPVRYKGEIVNIACFDYKHNNSKGFYMGVFYAYDDKELMDKFHKTVDCFIELDINYDEFDDEKIKEIKDWSLKTEEELNEHNVKWNK